MLRAIGYQTQRHRYTHLGASVAPRGAVDTPNPGSSSAAGIRYSVPSLRVDLLVRFRRSIHVMSDLRGRVAALGASISSGLSQATSALDMANERRRINRSQVRRAVGRH